MACYIVTGHRGAGKSLFAVHKAKAYLQRGRKVASNITLKTDHLLDAESKATYTKLPSVPRSADLVSLGRAYEGDYDEKKFGLAIFDEAGTWLNAREWNDPDRKALFQWATQSRKFGWDLILIIQDFDALDAQIRRSLTDIFVSASCSDRIKIPFTPFRLPKYHIYTMRYKGPNGMPTGREWFKGIEYRKCYNTDEQVGLEETLLESGDVVDARGTSTGLSAWHLIGRYLPPKPTKHDWFFFTLKWVLFWPVTLLAVIGLTAVCKTAREAIARDLVILQPNKYPHAAANEWSRRQQLTAAGRKLKPMTELVPYDRYTANLARSSIQLRRARLSSPYP